LSGLSASIRSKYSILSSKEGTPPVNLVTE
jgi:hypothetical protein